MFYMKTLEMYLFKLAIKLLKLKKEIKINES